MGNLFLQVPLFPLYQFLVFLPFNFFFKMAIQRMEEELKQKEANTKRFMTFLF